MINIFKKKELSEFNEKYSKLKKIISKSDDTSVTDAIDLINFLSATDLLAFNELILKEISKKNTSFVNGLTSKILVIDREIFSVAIVQELIDYMLRYGNSSMARSGVLLLKKYKEHTILLDRYKLVFVKDKRAQQMLKELY